MGSEYPLTFGVSEEPLTLGRAAEWTLETPAGPAIVLALRGWDGKTSLLLQRQVTVRVRVCGWSWEGQKREGTSAAREGKKLGVQQRAWD